MKNYEKTGLEGARESAGGTRWEAGQRKKGAPEVMKGE